MANVVHLRTEERPRSEPEVLSGEFEVTSCAEERSQFPTSTRKWRLGVKRRFAGDAPVYHVVGYPSSTLSVRPGVIVRLTALPVFEYGIQVYSIA